MRRLVIQLTTDDPERIATALTVGMAASAVGSRTDLWLSGPATALALPAPPLQYDLDYAPALADALDAIATTTVCAACAARRGLTQDDLRPGVAIAGAATLVEALLDSDSQALTY